MSRITIAQLNLTVGDIAGNVSAMIAAAEAAAREQSDLVVYPELSLTGYYPGDMLDDGSFLERVDAGLEQLKDASARLGKLHMAVGLPRRNAGAGKRLTNGLVVLHQGEIVGEYAKQLLPTYNIFDERRHFEPGPDRTLVLRIGDSRIGFLVCEDAWNGDGRAYAVNPMTRLADAKPDLVVTLNASPSNVGKREERMRHIGMASRAADVPVLYVNQVGGHDQLVYDGGSFAVEPKDPSGKGIYRIAHESARFAEEVRTLVLEGGHFGSIDPEQPLVGAPRTGLDTMEFYRQQILLGLRDYARRCGFTQAVVGCSGGIDSALTLALAVEAFGPANVVAITMPSRFSSEGSVSDSQRLCANLGIELIEHPIRDIVSRYEDGFGSAFGSPLEGLALENLQARVRGTILMEYSNARGHLLLTTGNKSEISVGYCTLYGDTNGGLGLIGDLFKTEVFELSAYLNAEAGREIIPEAILTKPPSAELAPGQKDTDSLPPYEVLDDILRILIEREENLSPVEAAHAAVRMSQLRQTPEGRATVERIRKLIARSEYKRRQAPPVLRLRGLAFGSGRQMPIAAVTV